jgi:hypothetical protein
MVYLGGSVKDGRQTRIVRTNRPRRKRETIKRTVKIGMEVAPI